VGIFRRGSKNGTKDKARHSSAEREPEITADVDAGMGVGEGDGSQDEADATSANAAPAPRPSRRGGPFDRSEVQGLEGRLDLGSLWLTGVAGMELRLEVEEESQNVVGVTAVLGDSAVQLQAFAAPRSEGIWDEIRTEIAASITSQGGTADKTSGPLGHELRAQMPGPGPDGRPVFSPVRFVGVDGPRWFLRAVLSGQAAIDESAASTLLDVVKATVVVRGEEAMAPRELLALRLPDQPDPAEASAEDEAADGSADQDGPPSLDDFHPFERGPEITEIH
jgi:Protein of unknown function (DUF3710)